MAVNLPNSTQGLVYTRNNHSNKDDYNQSNPNPYVDPNWKLSNDAQFVQSFLNRYSPDPNSDQTLSIPLNFQNATDLNQETLREMRVYMKNILTDCREVHQ